jgi:hypothetical protein
VAILRMGTLPPLSGLWTIRCLYYPKGSRRTEQCGKKFHPPRRVHPALRREARVSMLAAFRAMSASSIAPIRRSVFGVGANRDLTLLGSERIREVAVNA